MSEVAQISGPPGGVVVVYEAPDGGPRVEVVIQDETVWLTQRQMAELFDTSTDNVGRHIKNAYVEGELEEGATTEDSSAVQSEGGREVRRQIQHYNLDVVMSVGYRVKSKRGTHRRLANPNPRTPFMAAGIEDRIWTCKEIAALLG